MSRTLADMSAEERQQHAIWTEILNRNTSTDQERNNARIQLDALEFKSHSGPLMEKLTDLTDRLKLIEDKGQTLTQQDRDAVKTVRELSKTLDPKRLEALETNNGKALQGLADLAEMERNHHQDNQQGWSKLQAQIEELRQQATSTNQGNNDVHTRLNEKFREVESSIAALRRNLNDLVADAISEAKTAIMAEAHSAAVEAVGNLLGDVSDTPAPQVAVEADDDSVDC